MGIPLVSLVFAIFRPVFNWQPMVSGLKWTLLILWIVSATIFFICYTMQGFTFPGIADARVTDCYFSFSGGLGDIHLKYLQAILINHKYKYYESDAFLLS